MQQSRLDSVGHLDGVAVGRIGLLTGLHSVMAGRAELALRPCHELSGEAAAVGEAGPQLRWGCHDDAVECRLRLRG
jgi:hypothetical protein